MPRPNNMRAIEHRGESLTYMTVEPDNYQPDTPYPLIILMHGFGSHMGDLAGLAPAISQTDYVYAFPNAPIHMEMGFGAEGYAWTSLSEGDRAKLAKLSEIKLNGFFKEVFHLYHIEPGTVVLGGFSQGGMMAYRVGMARPRTFKGLAILSSILREDDQLLGCVDSEAGQSIFISHGTQDTIISVEDGRKSASLLEARGYTPEYREYEIGHEISTEVLSDLRRWLSRILPSDTPQN